MRFQVPQFIETEEKIVGPFTLRQFFWVGGAGTIVFVLFIGFGFLATFIVGIPVAGIALLMGFYKVQDIPLSTYAFNAIKYLFGPKRLYYKQEDNAPNDK